MTGMALIRPPDSIAWELRTCWATGRRVSLSLDCWYSPLRDDFRPRIEGHVARVAATGAYVIVAGWHVPMNRILAVHLPSRLGDSTVRGSGFHGRARRWVPQTEELPL